MVVTAAAYFLVQPLVFPIGVAFVADKNFRAFFRQLARSRNKVRVDVGFRHGGEAETVLGGEFQVTIHIALGIDDERLAGALATDEVGVLGEGVVGDLAEEHGFDWVRSLVRRISNRR